MEIQDAKILKEIISALPSPQLQIESNHFEILVIRCKQPSRISLVTVLRRKHF